MNLIVALFLSEIKRCSCCLGVLDTSQYVSGVLLHTRLSGVLPHAFIFLVCAHASCMKYIEQIKKSYEMPPKLDNVIKSPYYFRNVNLDKVQIKFNSSEKSRLWIPFLT